MTKRPPLPGERPLRDAWGRSAGRAAAAACREFVLERQSGVIGRIHTGQDGEIALDLAPHPADGDAEHTLAALDQVEDVLSGGALVDGGPIAHQGDAGQIVDAALPQRPDGHADLLQGHPGVQQPLDDLEHQDVAETVETLAAGALGAAHARLDQAGAGPVVELTIGDTGGLAGGWAAVTELAGGVHHLVEQDALAGLSRHSGPSSAIITAVGVHSYLRIRALRRGRMRAGAPTSPFCPWLDSISSPEGHVPVSAAGVSRLAAGCAGAHCAARSSTPRGRGRSPQDGPELRSRRPGCVAERPTRSCGPRARRTCAASPGAEGAVPPRRARGRLW